MKFLRTLLEELDVLYRFHVECFNDEGDKIDEVDVIAGTEKEAERLARDKSDRDVASALAVSKEDVE